MKLSLTKCFANFLASVAFVCVPCMSLALEDTHHAVIGPAKNITVLMKGPTNIVISWLPPHVYVHHDIIEPNSVAVGDTITVSKMKENMTMVAQNKSKSKESTFIANVAKRLKLGIPEPKQPEDQPHWECKPFAFFANYTVDVLSKIQPDKASPVIQLKDSDWATKKEEIYLHKNQAFVPFNEGCLEHYKVTWQEMKDIDENQTVQVQSKLIPPTVRVANISDLEPDTMFNISVIAVFKSDKEISGHPFIHERTLSLNASEDNEECKCDWQGTMSDHLKCNTTPGAEYCTCKDAYDGTFCERCAPGYYRSEPHFPCHACPCNTHGKNRTTCSFVEGFLRCDKCEVGYRGSMCHICDKGFYRYRRYCVPCHCNGNTPPDASPMCLPTTGMCRHCQYNTTGFHCDRCLHGYVGDPFTYKNCTLLREILGSSAKSAIPDNSKSSSGLSPGAIITIAMLSLLTIAAVGFLVFRRYESWKRGKAQPPWTVGMNPGGDAVDINSFHNDDARLDDYDDDNDAKHGAGNDVNLYEGKGEGRASKNKYHRLVEQA
ncbi:multiple epidermal growth factor-like domains 9 [Plakobranchus ocellatus]|uniref:Multiple epidermal growth factor-like domains 9 n=1 Tax=Plakobranchus ocellatus TaxID=259542 RepID=A0AAV4AQK8_9GAST|nr:multiple epidermal growth factor-like domains 9 [Plakobranchus ocellatus]